MKQNFIQLCAGLLSLFAALWLAATPAQAQRTISNVAHVEWGLPGAMQTVPSNRVDLLVDLPTNVPPVVDLFRIDRGVDTRLPLADSRCDATNGGGAGLSGPFTSFDRNPATLSRATAIHPGEPLVFVIDYAARNIDPGARDRFLAIIETDTGDRETIELVETASDSGVFTGWIRTAAMPPSPVHENCELSVQPGTSLGLELSGFGAATTVEFNVNILLALGSAVFDAETGAPVNGARITLIDADTGQPAQVFDADGVTPLPSTVTSGGPTLSSSAVNRVTGQALGPSMMAPGEFLFPLVAPGRYRLLVEPPDDYRGISHRSPQQLAGLQAPDGRHYRVIQGSYGDPFVLSSVSSVELDIPLDRPPPPLRIEKLASRQVAAPGDPIAFRISVRSGDPGRPTEALTVTDILPAALRLRPDSLRLNGEAAGNAATIAGDGRQFALAVAALAPGQTAIISYITEVLPQARDGISVNRVSVADDLGLQTATTDASVRIERDTIATRMTIIGRITDGGCSIDPRTAPGVAGVRVMLEDGSYAVTDEDGRYHFEGVRPGLHVVQIDEYSLPLDRAAVDCARNTRSAGRAFSRFVDGFGGALRRVDFRVAPSAPREAPASAAPIAPRAEAQSDAQAAGAERDWFAGREPGIAWLFPAEDHNPRNRVIRVAILHLPGQTVRLSINGEAVAPIAFDGLRQNEARTMAVSIWRGIGIAPRDNVLRAEVVGADGQIVETLTRTVHFANAPMRAELIRDRSVLVADGITRPVIAVRLTDRDGRPVHNGLTGDFAVPSPYFPAIEVDAQQARQLAGLERAAPVWRVDGDEGIAYIELEPTMFSGSLSISFPFRDGEARRNQAIDLWLEPGDRPWTIVGVAAGTVGFNTLSQSMEELGEEQDEFDVDGRVALYARGQVTGRWLMTLAYDSVSDRDESRFAGVIDPTRYYTVYADRSERRFDAASVRRLYLRLERPQFYAMFGDYETNINEPQLARYNRSLNGVRTEFRNDRVSAVAFAADTPYRFGRVEIQGNGLTGPYTIGSSQILPNSERVTIEVRDRFRSNVIVSSQTLIRHIDYDIDYFAGTLRFREPILSRDAALNPQFVVVEYEVDGIAESAIQAGGRVTWNTADDRLQIGATLIHDDDSRRQTTLGGLDVRWRPDDATEIRAEFAASDSDSDVPTAGTAPSADGVATAWLIEAEHHSSDIDVLAYAREQQGGFGVGQLNGAESGTRKIGFDGRVRLGGPLSIAASGWHENYLTSDTRRIAGRALLEYHGEDTDGRLGLIYANDRLTDGSQRNSTLLQLGATQRLFGDRLELDGQTEFALDQAESVDFPARHALTARFRATDWATLIGTYEIADGNDFTVSTFRAGFELAPWAGARISMTGNQQDIAEYGPRSFAAYGFAQSLVLDEHWSIDVSLDGNETLSGGIDPQAIINPEHPVASGGFLGSGNTLTEDFVALTTGVTYRNGSWSATGRAEWRDGEREDRRGFTLSALRQIGEGSAIGGAFSWLRADQQGGAATEVTSLELSWAHRPASSDWSWLNKLELRDDRVTNAIAGQPGPIGSAPLLLTGDARSQRIVNSLSINWSPSSEVSDLLGGTTFLDRSEASLFIGTRYVSERFGADDIDGWSNIVAGDIRFDLSEMFDIGVSGAIRESDGGRAWHWSAGPTIGISPVENTWITIGYNIVGFEDRDFEEARYTRQGPYVTFRFRFDQQTFRDLGL